MRLFPRNVSFVQCGKPWAVGVGWQKIGHASQRIGGIGREVVTLIPGRKFSGRALQCGIHVWTCSSSVPLPLPYGNTHADPDRHRRNGNDLPPVQLTIPSLSTGQNDRANLQSTKDPRSAFPLDIFLSISESIGVFYPFPNEAQISRVPSCPRLDSTSIAMSIVQSGCSKIIFIRGIKTFSPCRSLVPTCPFQGPPGSAQSVNCQEIWLGNRHCRVVSKGSKQGSQVPGP